MGIVHKTVSSASVAALALIFTSPAMAATVYQSIPTYDAAGAGALQGVSFSGLTGGRFGSTEIFSRFSLAALTQLNAIDLVGQGPDGANAPYSAVVSIYGVNGAEPNAALYSTSVTFGTPTAFAGGFNSFTTAISTQLAAGSYYLGLRPTTGAQNAHPLFAGAAANQTLLGAYGGSPNDYDASLTGFGGQAFRFDGAAVMAGVPEPTTWAMMIAGFGLIGGAMRRRAVNYAFA